MGLPQGATRLFLAPLGLRGRGLARVRRRPARLRFSGPRVPGLGAPGGGLRPGPGVRTLYLDPFGDWEPEDLRYCYDRGLVVGAAQRVLATVINFWDALDRKREMPIVPAAREVYYRDGDGRTWDLAIRVPARFDPASYEWGSRPAMAGLWPGASLLWPVCERGRLSAVLPPGQLRPPDWGGAQRVFWYSDRPLPRATGRWPHEVRGAEVVIIDGPGGLPPRRLVWLIKYGPPDRYMGLYETRGAHDHRQVRRLRDMLLATLRMAGYQPRVSYQLLGLALRPSRKPPHYASPQVRSRGQARGVWGCGSTRGRLRQECCAGRGGGGGIGPRTKPPRPAGHTPPSR